jgi:F-type H+-transporting ATPase subunit alpha
VGSAAQIKAIKKVAGKVKLQLAQFRELAAFAQFGSDLDAKTKAQLERGARVVELFKQTAFNPIPVEVQSSLIWAVQNGYFDAIEVSKIVEATSNLREFLETRGAQLMDTIRSEKAISSDSEATLKSTLSEWSTGFTA